MTSEAPLKLSEAEWWERFSDLATLQWELATPFHEIVRREYLNEMHEHLHIAGGSLLDIGCGSGWAGLEAASSDMQLVGIDTSSAQIKKARQQTQIIGYSNSRFETINISNLDPHQTFDSVLIHAVLHHIREEDIKILLAQVWQRLKPDGKLFIYEPLSGPRLGFGNSLVASIVFLFSWSPFWLLKRIDKHLRFGSAAYRDALRDGWTGLSPDEKPILREWVIKALEPGFKVTRVHYWQAYSLALAMGCSNLPQKVHSLAEWIVRAYYWLDKRILNTSLNDSIRGVWTWASISARKT